MSKELIALLIVIFLITIVGIVALINLVIFLRRKNDNNSFDKEIQNSFSKVLNETDSIIKEVKEIKEKNFKNFTDETIKKLDEKLKDINDTANKMTKEIGDFNTSQQKSLSNIYEGINKKITEGLKEIDESSKKQLDIIRKNIDEQLKTELQNKLDEHFKNVSEKMGELTTNLTKFETIEKSVIDLNRTFSNNKEKGNFGELGLEMLLENNLNKTLWGKQINLYKLETTGSLEQDDDSKTGEKVDFVIKMNLSDGKTKYIPIDAKFPTLDYIEYDNANSKEEREKALKELKKTITKMAKDINDKYIKPNITTEYAILYLPSEAIYGTIVSNADFSSKIFSDQNVLIAGPTTILAIISNIKITTSNVAFAENVKNVKDLLNTIHGYYEKILDSMEKGKKQSENTTKSIEDSLIKIRKINKSLTSAKSKNEIEPLPANEQTVNPLTKSLEEEQEIEK